MSEKAVRISITIPEALYRKFEQVARKAGFKKRSRAVGEALKCFISEYKSLEALPKASCTGTIIFTYLHDKPGLLEAITDLQHQYGKIITSSLHVHLDPERCLETIVIKGNTEVFREIVERLKTLRVDKVQYVVIPQKTG
jgi:CopG family nickel-responsive transcriptional regulator